MTGSRRNPTRRLASAAVVTAALAALMLPQPAFANCHAFSFTPPTYEVNEGAGKVTITVKRDGQFAPSSVKVRTVNGTATAGQDYTKVDRRITFETGTQQTFDVPILDDDMVEGNEEFTVRLSDGEGTTCRPSPDQFFHGNPATVTILDNDEAAAPPAQSSPTQPRQSPAAEPTESPTPDEEAIPEDDDSPSPGGALEFGEEAATQTVGDDGGGLPTAAVVSILGVLIAAGAAIGLWLLQRRKAAAAE